MADKVAYFHQILIEDFFIEETRQNLGCKPCPLSPNRGVNPCEVYYPFEKFTIKFCIAFLSQMSFQEYNVTG